MPPVCVALCWRSRKCHTLLCSRLFGPPEVNLPHRSRVSTESGRDRRTSNHPASPTSLEWCLICSTRLLSATCCTGRAKVTSNSKSALISKSSATVTEWQSISRITYINKQSVNASQPHRAAHSRTPAQIRLAQVDPLVRSAHKVFLALGLIRFG